MHLDELKKLVKMEEDSQGFPSIHEAVIAYIFSLTASVTPATFWSNHAQSNLPVPSQSVIDEAQKVGKIAAIKLYKIQTGLSLLTAKRGIEDYFEGEGLGFKRWN